MGVFNVSLVDTTPGSDQECPFTPPSGWDGGKPDYLELMRRRYRCVGHYQRMHVTANFANRGSIEVVGPFADEAKDIIMAMRNKLK